MTYRIGSLFSGYGGLEMGIRAVIDSDIAWCCEIEPAAIAVTRRHHPDTPNLGDITAVDWPEVEPVDILAGGFPCTDVSSAGKRAGLRPGTRSGLWTHMAYAVSQLKPALVVIENVRGLLSADAHCDLEPCPWCLGDSEGRPLRALGAVLGDLAELGYDTRWCGLRASDVGAPHGRFRVFITAWPATDTDGFGYLEAQWAGSREAAHGRSCDTSGRCGAAAADTVGVRRRSQRRHDGLRPAGLVTGAVPDADRERLEGRRPAGPQASWGRQGWRPLQPVHVDINSRQEVRPGQKEPGRCDSAAVDPGPPIWGRYESAIRRWERILNRPAPSPTVTGKRGGQQLAPVFVEWLMGLPKGWVTDAPGLGRNDQLKVLGNGVVPQQAAAALTGAAR